MKHVSRLDTQTLEKQIVGGPTHTNQLAEDLRVGFGRYLFSIFMKKFTNIFQITNIGVSEYVYLLQCKRLYRISGQDVQYRNGRIY